MFIQRRSFVIFAFLGSILIAILFCYGRNTEKVQNKTYDVVVYGATPAGITAALTLQRLGASVAIIEASQHIGGMVTSGLGNTDLIHQENYGGLAAEFFQKVGSYYGSKSAVFRFEPHVAANVFEQMLAAGSIPLFRGKAIASVRKDEVRISAIVSTDGSQFLGSVFIDASYEGDLMARAGVTYVVGRESSEEYGESLAGFRLNSGDTRTQFAKDISGLDAAGKLLPGIQSSEIAEPGSGDKKVMAYNYRVCLSAIAENQRAFARPDFYDEKDYELLLRYLEAFPTLRLPNLMLFAELPNRKFDINNFGPVSTNFIGESWNYPEADFTERAEIARKHRQYIEGFFYTLTVHPRVPQPLRDETKTWGYCADEFVNNENFPPQLYIRGARRMVGNYVMTQKDLLQFTGKDDAVAIGEMPIESHHVQRIVNSAGMVRDEGHQLNRSVRAYQIPYGSLTPKAEEAENLIVPVALSASHIAYSSMRMEPVYMVLGQSAGAAAYLALKNGSAVQSVSPQGLCDLLTKQGQNLSLSFARIQE